MKSARITILLSMLCLSVEAQQVLNGVTLPAKLTHDQTELILNGGGIRKKLFFKVYVAGLYLSTKNKNGYEICLVDKSMALRLQITSSMVNSNNMSQSIREGFSKSMKGNVTPLKEKIETFINMFNKEKIVEGDVFDIWYAPGIGTTTFKNERLQGVISGLDFKKALLGIWLSDSPVDTDLKSGLLGN